MSVFPSGPCSFMCTPPPMHTRLTARPCSNRGIGDGEFGPAEILPFDNSYYQEGVDLFLVVDFNQVSAPHAHVTCMYTHILYVHSNCAGSFACSPIHSAQDGNSDIVFLAETSNGPPLGRQLDMLL